MKTKLCYVLSNYDPASHEHYYHLHELVSLLAKDHDIFFFAESGNRNVRIPGITKYYIQKFNFLPFRLLERTLVFVYIYLLGFRKFYCHYADTSTIILSLLARVFGGTTYKWHCVQEHFYRKPFSFKHLKEKLTRELPLHLSLTLTQFLVTSSNAMRNYYYRNFHINPKKTIIIPNFINLNRFTSSKQSKSVIKKRLELPSKPILLFVHRLSERKGADRLIDYAQTIKQANLKLFILAIGKGPLFRHLKNKTHQLNLQNQIRFLGSVSNRELPDYYQVSDVFIMPSRIEEFARVQLEAMASGLPIIATQTMATLSVLSNRQQRLIVKQSNHTEIPALANKLLHDKIFYSKMIQEGHDRVKNYSLKKIGKQFSQKIILPHQRSGPNPSPRVKWVASQVKPGIVLDIGFVGSFLSQPVLHQTISQKASIVGIDLNQQKVFKAKLPNTLVANAFHLPFKNKTFDQIVIGEVLEHFANFRQLITESHRVLKKGGRLTITTPSPYALFRHFKHWVFAHNHLSSKTVRSFLESPEHVHFIEPFSLANHLHDQGFTIKSSTTLSLGLPYLPSNLRQAYLNFWPLNRLGTNLCLTAIKKN